MHGPCPPADQVSIPLRARSDACRVAGFFPALYGPFPRSAGIPKEKPEHQQKAGKSQA